MCMSLFSSFISARTLTMAMQTRCARALLILANRYRHPNRHCHPSRHHPNPMLPSRQHPNRHRHPSRQHPNPMLPSRHHPNRRHRKPMPPLLLLLQSARRHLNFSPRYAELEEILAQSFRRMHYFCRKSHDMGLLSYAWPGPAWPAPLARLLMRAAPTSI